jgi:hypothetical protein
LIEIHINSLYYVKKIPENERFAEFQRKTNNEFVLSRLPRERAQIDTMSKNIYTVTNSVKDKIKCNYDETNMLFKKMENKIDGLEQQLTKLQAEAFIQNQQYEKVINQQNYMSDRIDQLINKTEKLISLLSNNSDSGTNSRIPTMSDSETSNTQVNLERNISINSIPTTSNNNTIINNVLLASNNNENNINFDFNNLITNNTDDLTEQNTDNYENQNNIRRNNNSANNRQNALPGNATLDIRTTPRKPAIRPNCPTSWKAILLEWNNESLGAFEHSKKIGWDATHHSRYAKRVRIMKQIRRVSNEFDKFYPKTTGRELGDECQ